MGVTLAKHDLIVLKGYNVIIMCIFFLNRDYRLGEKKIGTAMLIF